MSDPKKPDSRDVRADARDVRADARDVRADTKDTDLTDRGVRAEVREDVVTEREGTVTGSIKLLKWLVIVLIVISFGNFLRSFSNQASADKATEAAERVEKTSIQGRDAAQQTLRELRAIVSRIEETGENQPDLQNQAIIDALEAIARIEGFVCGGTCPEPGMPDQ